MNNGEEEEVMGGEIQGWRERRRMGSEVRWR